MGQTCCTSSHLQQNEIPGSKPEDAGQTQVEQHPQLETSNTQPQPTEKKQGEDEVDFINFQASHEKKKLEELDGYHELTYPDGDVYKGQIKENMRNGKGIMQFYDGRRYEGFWFDDLMYGVGIMQYPDGSKYEGRFVDNKREGWGNYIEANGDKYEGQWQQDLKHGEGTLTQKGHKNVHGWWANGQLVRERKDSESEIQDDE